MAEDHFSRATDTAPHPDNPANQTEPGDMTLLARRARPAPLRQVAYDGIVDLLNRGRLRPGTMVSQRDLVDWTGATLGSVREAVSHLRAEGLLLTLPKRGLMVPDIDATFVGEAYQMRRMIEMTAIPEVLTRMPRAELDDWIARHEAIESRLADGETDQAISNDLQRLDWVLHEALVRCMANGLIAEVYRVTAIKIRMAVQSRLQVTQDNARRVVMEHLAFLRALGAGDEARATTALAHHLNNSLALALGKTVRDNAR